VFTQELPQSISLLAQVAVHLPAEQTWPPTHLVPQAPQLFASVCVSLHVVPQSVVPPPQDVAQAPFEQT
jgi:hypothetical protein